MLAAIQKEKKHETGLSNALHIINKVSVSRRRHPPNVKPDSPAAASTSISLPGSREAQHEPKIVDIVVTVLTRHWLGGLAKNAPPLANFLNNLKTSADIDAKLTVPYTASF